MELSKTSYVCAPRIRRLFRKRKYLNRGKKGTLPPSIRYAKEVILRVLIDMKKRLNITSAKIEQGQFDTSSMAAGHKLVGKEYQQSEFEGENFKQKVLWRDNYTCQHCGSKKKLRAHHIIWDINGGSDTVGNGVTLCEDCHESLHRGEWVFTKKVKMFKYPAHLQQGKWWIYDRLKEMFSDVSICFGWETFKSRIALGLPKDHHYDASAMLGCSDYRTFIYNIKPKRTKERINNVKKTCTEKNGFKHYDVVKYFHRDKGIIIGSVRSLKKKAISLRTLFDKDFCGSYARVKLLQRPNGLIYTY